MMALASALSLLPLLVTMVTGQSSSLMPDYFDHPCVRSCEDNGEAMECRYRFVAESYQTMARACYECAQGTAQDCSRAHCVTANGVSRNIKTINRGIPGPTIQVCEGDRVIVDLENYFAMAEGVTIHWHGILQNGSPYMDGVGMITQCPIQAATSFTYDFQAVDPGTHFWHAHTGLQRGEGMFGSFVVRQSPANEPQVDLYDFDLPEHVITLAEWQNKPLVDVYTASNHAGGTQTADAVLINGRATDPTGAVTLPRAEFSVQAGQRYRFRVINAGSLFCPVEISVDGHNLTLIASDGRPFEPFVVESFDTFSAERYDFVLSTDQEVGDYWLRATGLGSCDGLEELARVRYTAPAPQLQHDAQPPAPVPVLTARPPRTRPVFNSIPVNVSEPLGDSQDQILGMNALAPDDPSLTSDPQHQFILDFDMREVTNLHYFDPDLYPANAAAPYPSLFSAQVNKISNTLGPVPLLGQMSQIPEESFCNADTVGDACATEWCECVHKLTVTQGQVVEMVFISPAGEGFTHPIHLHGFSFRVVAMTRVDSVERMTPEIFRQMDADGSVERKLSKAPFKDTVPIPNGGYTIIRFVADNPGVWFAHCHLAFHAEIGMSISLEVLQPDGQLPAPPANFPTCGPFTPASLNKPPASARKDQTPKRTALKSPGLGSQGLRSPAVDPQTVVPQWVLPVVLSLSAVLLVLAVTTLRLWHKNKTLKRTEHQIAFPSYQAGGESAREDVDQLTSAKKLERISLTH